MNAYLVELLREIGFRLTVNQQWLCVLCWFAFVLT